MYNRMNKLNRDAAIIQGLILALTLAQASSAQSSRAVKGPSNHLISIEPTATKETASESLTVEVVNAPVVDKESQEVLDALKNLMQGLEHHNLEEVGACLSDNVTQIDEKKNKVLFGKPEVLENAKKNLIGAGNVSPVKKLMIYSPFIRIKGDTAMVSFRATKEMTGEHPIKLESWCSEVFERKDGHWLVLQLKTNWKTIH